MDKFEQIAEILKKARRVAILTGAGVSAESGIATFRDPDGLWAKFNPTELASMNGFLSNPQLVWEWYQYRRKLIAEAKPNAGHIAIAQMENMFEFFSLATQNVDRLHHRAGSKNVIELHGNIIENYCVDCGSYYNDPINYEDKNLLQCNKCGGKIRPAVVWFGEMLPQDELEKAYYAAETSEVYFSIGTSAEVYPAADLPKHAKRNGAILIEINPNPTALTYYVDFKIAEPSAIALPKILNLLKGEK
jgi:NAD-dependent deacetylase